MRFDDKVVVLTGVGREGQVGEAVARAFAERGAALALLDVVTDEVQARAATLAGAGFRATPYPCDLTDPARVADTARRVGEAFDGRVDVLINAAGGFAMSGPVADSALEVWQRQLAINLTTAYLATRAFLPLVRAARGSIIYFASEAALPGARIAGMSAYAAAKSAVATLMRAVAQEERGTGVRANAVAPAAIRTAANIQAMGADARYVEREDVAAALLFLASEDARAISGQIVQLS